MIKKVFAILALIAFVVVMIDVFFVHYALEIVLPIYIVAMIAGVIIVVFSNTAAASHKAAEVRGEEDGNSDGERTDAQETDLPETVPDGADTAKGAADAD